MRVLIPLPDHDFDVTEVAGSWRLLTDAGHEVVFTAEHGGHPSQADHLLLGGVLFGQLGAEPGPKGFYEQLTEAAEYREPTAWAAVEPAECDGLVLPGGHAPGMRQYLVPSCCRERLPSSGHWTGRWARSATACWCWRVRRIRAPAAGCSPDAARRACRSTWSARRTSSPRGGVAGTTAPILTYVQEEVVAAGAVFERGPAELSRRGPVELSRRGTAADDTSAFVVRDGNYVSARWPGDAYLFARTFASLLER
ncbi:type 1 glutamine amidotransferase domain-containing protein [Lentzea indica]|uniref:type 1 glutamine amidotransferase domain-containing protein n=1 Tax=Lentzea indica TaxID=2604800 RepID=UPI001CB70BD6|nr:type 1 glutamine amidotransferase domain-containing protein [Lentzea indica]